jgi:hypothetical protein
MDRKYAKIIEQLCTRMIRYGLLLTFLIGLAYSYLEIYCLTDVNIHQAYCGFAGLLFVGSYAMFVLDRRIRRYLRQLIRHTTTTWLFRKAIALAFLQIAENFLVVLSPLTMTAAWGILFKEGFSLLFITCC